VAECGIRVEHQVELGHINLRGKRQDPAFAKAVENCCGFELPDALRVAGEGDLRIFWLGPDEWLLEAAPERISGLAAQLIAETSGQHVAVTDLSDSYVCYTLSGNSVRQLLARGCTLNLHPKVFTAGSCTQTGLAKATVLLALQGDRFALKLRRSFSDYLLQWMRVAGAEYGIEFS